jgi:hypothetical protein
MCALTIRLIACLVYSLHSVTSTGLPIKTIPQFFVGQSLRCGMFCSICLVLYPYLSYHRVCEVCYCSFFLHVAYSYFVIHFGDPIGGVEQIVWFVYFHAI